jgi:serine/threonine protein kinase
MARSGDTIGPYTLVRRVGRGGFGEVWLAEKKTKIATTEFALKLAMDENPDIEAIRREADLWKRASGHPNILPIIEADIYDEWVVVVSEFVRGGSLKEWLGRNSGRAPTVDAALQMTAGVLSGLEHLHALRIIHRDLKPSNILLQGDRPRLADFGLARVLKTSGFSQSIAGTPEYMAPEAFSNERSEQADLWSVGVMLYQMLAGHLPFVFNRGMSPLQKMAVITTRDVTPLPAGLPQTLRQLVIRSLEKNPDERYGSASEMLTAISNAAEPPRYGTREHSVPHGADPRLSPVQAEPTVSAEAYIFEAELSKVTTVAAVPVPTPETRRVPAAPGAESALPDFRTGPAPVETAPREAMQATDAPDYKRMRRPLGWIMIIVAAAIGIAVPAMYLGRHRDNIAVGEASSPPVQNSQQFVSPDTGATPPPAPVDVATCYLELEQSRGLRARSAGNEPLRPGQKYKLIFIPRQHGYLYIIAPGAKGSPTTYLTAKPLPKTGVETNEVETGRNFEFPAGDNWMKVQKGRRSPDLTVFLSTDQVLKPFFLATTAGLNLNAAELREIQSVGQRAYVTLDGDHLVVRAAPAGVGVLPTLLVFGIQVPADGN